MCETIWFGHTMHAVAVGVVILLKRRFHLMLRLIRKYPATIAGESIFDTLAWVPFAIATTMIPISIATAISGGYVALAVLLGIFVNREPLKPHQMIGVGAVIIGVISLSAIV